MQGSQMGSHKTPECLVWVDIRIKTLVRVVLTLRMPLTCRASYFCRGSEEERSDVPHGRILSDPGLHAGT